MSKTLRRHPRYVINRGVYIETPEPIACSLADVSQAGARIILEHARPLPDEFVLHLSDELKRWCRVRWRSDNETGVEFIARSLETVLI